MSRPPAGGIRGGNSGFSFSVPQAPIHRNPFASDMEVKSQEVARELQSAGVISSEVDLNFGSMESMY